jgi:hypothetical protein
MNTNSLNNVSLYTKIGNSKIESKQQFEFELIWKIVNRFELI